MTEFCIKNLKSLFKQIYDQYLFRTGQSNVKWILLLMKIFDKILI
jgi:hypothetical protein